MVRLIRACSYSDYQISMTIRNATDFFRCWTGFPTRYFSISDSENRAAAVWKTALTGAWGSASTSRKTIRSVNAEWMVFRICIYRCIACYYYTKFGIIVASNAYGAPYAKNAASADLSVFCLLGSLPNPLNHKFLVSYAPDGAYVSCATPFESNDVMLIWDWLNMRYRV